MYERCGDCEDAQRVACEALFSSFRLDTLQVVAVEAGETLDDDMDLAQLVDGVFSKKTAAQRKLTDGLRELGCTLTPQEMAEAASSESQNTLRSNVDVITTQSTELIEQVRGSDREHVIAEFCVGKERDFDSLSYIDRIELSTKLIRLGYKGLFG